MALAFTCSKRFTIFYLVIGLINNPLSVDQYYHPHFADGNVEAERERTVCLRPLSAFMTETRFEQGLSQFIVQSPDHYATPPP